MTTDTLTLARQLAAKCCSEYREEISAEGQEAFAQKLVSYLDHGCFLHRLVSATSEDRIVQISSAGVNRVMALTERGRILSGWFDGGKVQYVWEEIVLPSVLNPLRASE